MMKRLISVFLAAVFVFVMSSTAFAADVKLIFESSYNADTNQVSVMVYVENPGEMTSADLRLGYNQDVFEYVESEDNRTISGFVVTSGLAATNAGLVCTSAMFMEHCQESDLTDGRLYFATFVFTPLTEDYDINDFCLWAYSYDIDDTDISKSIATVGDINLKNGKTEIVSAKDSDDDSSSSVAEKLNGKWYVYVIAVVAGVAIVAGVAVIAVKNGDKEEKENSSSDDND